MCSLWPAINPAAINPEPCRWPGGPQLCARFGLPSTLPLQTLNPVAGQADRNSARRTTVVDDQADFFEIDGNAWLSDEVRRGAHPQCVITSQSA